MDIYIVIFIFWFHFASDFLLQDDKMALNKSSSNKWLSIHCIVYGIPFIVFGFISMVLIVISHFVVDYYTSRGTTKLWLADERHWFFCLIGFDQALHLTLLILIIYYFGKI